MKRNGTKRRAVSVFTSIVALAFLLCALYASRYATDVFAGVKNTKHDLSVNSTGATIKAQASSGVTETCVFCHTPHGAISDVPDAPLWNHNVSNVTYTLLPKGIDTATAVQQPDRGSKLCLSCHDGTIAIGAVRNKPGAGQGAGNISMSGVDLQGRMPTTALGYVGTNLNPYAGSANHIVSVAVNDKLIEHHTTANGFSSNLTYPTNAAVKLKRTNNKYICYMDGGVVPNTGEPCNDTDYGYGKEIPAGSGRYYGVQCASCHNPHDNTYTHFLVMDNTGMAICTVCHAT